MPNGKPKYRRETLTHRLDDSYTKEIGHIAVQWSAVELSINYALWAVAEIPEGIGACLTAQIYTLDGRLKALLALLKVREAPENLIDTVNKFADDARGPQELRNRIIHDAWGRKGDSTARLEITAPRKLKFAVLPVSLDELRATTSTIEEFANRARGLRMDIYDALPSLLEIPSTKLRHITDPLRGQ